MFRHAGAMGLEMIVSKRRDQPRLKCYRGSSCGSAALNSGLEIEAATWQVRLGMVVYYAVFREPMWKGRGGSMSVFPLIPPKSVCPAEQDCTASRS
jgi:hypothetical protein